YVGQRRLDHRRRAAMSRSLTPARLSLMLLVTGGAFALPPEPISGPVTGYVYDAAARGIRPIQGIPGSAMLAAPVTLSFDLESAVLSGGGSFALARSSGADSQIWVLRNLDTSEPGARPLQGGIAGAQMALNKNGSAAVLY